MFAFPFFTRPKTPSGKSSDSSNKRPQLQAWTDADVHFGFNTSSSSSTPTRSKSSRPPRLRLETASESDALGEKGALSVSRDPFNTMLAWADEDDDPFTSRRPAVRPRAQSQTSPRRDRSASFRKNGSSSSYGRKSSVNWQKIVTEEVSEDKPANDKLLDDTVLIEDKEDKQATLKPRSASASPTKHRPPPLQKTESSSSLPEETEDPKSIVGKIVKSIHRSAVHPTLFLNFSDDSRYQVMVRGYDPVHPGVQKLLELDSFLEPLLKPGVTTSLGFKVADCALIRLRDKAFERRTTPTSERTSFSSSSSDGSTLVTPVEDLKWEQNHMSLALKFEDVDGWHCISASMQEHDEEQDSAIDLDLNSPSFSPTKEIFRSYEDVYLKRLPDNILTPLSSRARKGSNSFNHKRSESAWSFSSTEL